jgi:hypothetical protein
MHLGLFPRQFIVYFLLLVFIIRFIVKEIDFGFGLLIGRFLLFVVAVDKVLVLVSWLLALFLKNVLPAFHAVNLRARFEKVVNQVPLEICVIDVIDRDEIVVEPGDPRGPVGRLAVRNQPLTCFCFHFTSRIFRLFD